MKTNLKSLSLSIALFSAIAGFSQNNQIQPCVTVNAMEEYFKLNPGAREKFQANQDVLQKQYLENEKNMTANKSAAVQYTIPVVFHILHQGGAENISDAAVIAALAQINSDYAAAGADASTVFAPFQAGYINSDMKFMLAKKDENGNCTTGIIHHYDSRTVWDRNPPSSAFNPALYTGITWNTTKYLNIIIVKDIVAAPSQNGTVVGYTTLPGNLANGAVQDAIVYNYGFLGGLNARSLSHEIGHWFNLTHTFGNTNNPGVVCGSTAGGDGVADTPDTKGNFSTCPASSTNTAFTCTSPNPTNSANYYQNVENFMDYSSCPKNFTTGQTTKMRTAAQSTVSSRSNLWSPSNLTATDVNGTAPCAPVAQFLPYFNLLISYSVCSGGSLLMKDYSYNASTINYSWTADNGAVIANPTLSNTSISFPTQGVSNVSLTVSNAQGSNTIVKQITVLNGQASVTGPYSESFEAPGTPANWNVINPSGSAIWAHTNIAALDGSSSFYIDGSQSAAGEQEILVTPVMDILNNPNDSLKFSYAYARSSATQNDKLEVQASLDCGGSWEVLTSLSAAQLQAGSGGTNATPFIPTPSQWKQVNLTNAGNWFDLINSPSVTFRFVFTESSTAGGGNNIFIDAVKFEGGPTGINELTKSYKLNLYPNPSNGEATLKFNLNDAATVNLNIVNILGENVLPTINYNYGSGEQIVSINKNNTLSKGIYFVNISINGAKMSKKLVIN
jgi:hypothetical protein